MRIGMGVAGVLSIALGVAGLLGYEGKDGSDPVVDALLLVPFGLGMLLIGPLVGATTPDGARPPEVGSADFRGTVQPALLFRSSSRRWWLAQAAALLFAVAGVGLILDGSVVVGSSALAFFGLGGLYLLADWIRGDRRIELALTHDGLVLRAGRASAAIDWDDVVEVFAIVIAGTTYLAIDAAGRVDHTSAFSRRFAPFGRRMAKGGDLVINVNLLKQNPEALAERIRRCVADRAERRRLTA